MDTCGIFEKFDLQKNLIKEYQYWYLLIRKRQSYLGNCVVILKRHAFPISQLTPYEHQESLQIIQEVENSLTKSFQANFTQQTTIMFVDQHIHFFIFPRYKSNIDFNNKVWLDDQVPDPLINKCLDSKQNEIDIIKNIIIKNLI